MTAIRSHIVKKQIFDTAEEMAWQGWGIMEFPVDEFVGPVLAGWRKFLKLPWEERSLWNVDLRNPDPNDVLGRASDPDRGYYFRDGEKKHEGSEGKYDRKHIFHYKKSLVNCFRWPIGNPQGQRMWEESIGTHTKWLIDMAKLHEQCQEQLLKLCRALDLIVTGHNFSGGVATRLAHECNTTRLVTYSPATSVGQSVGKSHFDRDFMTIHIDESHQGLTLVSKDGKKFSYKKRPGQVLVFPSAKCWKHTNGKLPCTEHMAEVVQETVGQPRDAFIFFGHNNTDITAEEMDALSRKHLKYKVA